MQHSLRARVHNGRLLLDEPTELPENTELELIPLSELHEPERLALDAALEQASHRLDAGDYVDGESVKAWLRSLG